MKEKLIVFIPSTMRCFHKRRTLQVAPLRALLQPCLMLKVELVVMRVAIPPTIVPTRWALQPALTQPSLAHNGRRMRPCFSNTSSSMSLTKETLQLRTSLTLTGKLLPTWFLAVRHCSAKSVGSSFRILRVRNQLGRLVRRKSSRKLPKKLPRKACPEI